MKGFLICLIQSYQMILSPFLGTNCRFRPSCSNYAIQSIKIKGPILGSWIATKRITRCHPWNKGGYDPVPGTGRNE